MRFLLAWAAAASMLSAGCGASGADSRPRSIDDAARAYVRVVLALADRDSDSLDSYHGPAEWQAQAVAEHLKLPEVRARALALIASLDDGMKGVTGTGDAQPQRQAFLVRQLEAVAARVDILAGARPPFDEEARRLFGLAPHRGGAAVGSDGDEGAPNSDAAAVRAELERLLSGSGDLTARYSAFDRQFVVSPDRLPAVLERAIDGCRAATAAHMSLPAGERVRIEYAHDLPWSAFTRYEGQLVSRIVVNAALPLTVDRALDLACHEAYPGHHTISALLDARFGAGRPEFLVQPLFSPQSALHEAAASVAPAIAFPDSARLVFERDTLFPLAGLDPSRASQYVAVSRLVDRLHDAEGDVVRRYLDGALDFPRAAAALGREALMPAPDATLKFVNQFRSYAATYTFGRDAFARIAGSDWRVYERLVTDPAQALPRPNERRAAPGS
jgi:hypothetical protein